MQITKIPYYQTGKFSALVQDYLNHNDFISSFFAHKPNLAGIKDQQKAKANFDPVLRKTLADVIKTQYGKLNLAPEDITTVNARIALLQNTNTFTVTTGHQLCLFTGPLYTVYKILHTLALSDYLNKNLAGKHIIPVFWMATEDHDFEEINHAYLGEHRVTWHQKSGDAVGRLTNDGIEKAIEAVAQILPIGGRSEELIADLKYAYAHENLADATRALVHKWFGHKGLLIVDGDDTDLKRAMIPVFEAELFEQRSFRALTKTNDFLAEKYPLQVVGRDINLFYLHNQNRYRLATTETGFEAIGGHLHFSEQSIKETLHAQPERFSPNVVLRPLYQETILPNLAYVGGGGEVGYWAQLKNIFQDFGVPMPVVLLRQSVGVLSANHAKNLGQMGFSVADLFLPFHELKMNFLKKKRDYSTEIEKEQQSIDAHFETLIALAKDVDKSLEKHAEAQKQRSQNSIKNIEKKIWRAASKNENTDLLRLEAALKQFAPNGGLQERKQNVLPFLQQNGHQWFDEVQAAIEPLDHQFIIFTTP